MTSVSVQQMLKEHGADSGAAVTVTPGTYQLKVVRCPITKKDGTDSGVMPIYEIVGGPDAGKTVIAGSLWLTQAAAPIFFRNLRAFGLTNEFVEQGATLKDIADALVGRTVEIELGVQNYKGEDRNEFKPGAIKLLAAPDGAPDGLPQAAAPAAATLTVTQAPAPPAPTTAPAPTAIGTEAGGPTPQAVTVPPPPPATADAPPF